MVLRNEIDSEIGQAFRFRIGAKAVALRLAGPRNQENQREISPCSTEVRDYPWHTDSLGTYRLFEDEA